MANGIKEIYLIAGHSNGDPGAIGVKKTKEADLTKELRDLVAQRLKLKNVPVVTDDDRLSLSQVLSSIKSTEQDIVCDIHFNASENPKANGVEVLIPGRHTTKERTGALRILTGITAATGLRSRGVITELQSHRGSLGVMRESGSNFLIEVCFISNQNDFEVYHQKKTAVADSIADSLLQIYNEL
jgi:N-acetylmuramoyl-L-alanine amidase